MALLPAVVSGGALLKHPVLRFTLVCIGRRGWGKGSMNTSLLLADAHLMRTLAASCCHGIVRVSSVRF